jgi:ATP-dependent exoDNAse (exonuclease V) alpha subunit
MELNEKQLKASEKIYKFIKSDNENFLLLGPAGSGKTTVIVHALANEPYNIAFCAFTNKATSVLFNKSAFSEHTKFLTIHKLLNLEISYVEGEEDIKFKYDIKNLARMSLFDIIILDECSTISSELYGYLMDARQYVKNKFDKVIKYIFLGDYWQLPPVKEKLSIVFSESKNESWNISRLEKVMRCQNDNINSNSIEINNKLLSKIKDIKEGNDDFMDRFPFNIDSTINTAQMIEKYILELKENRDIIILTYSKGNANTINNAVQDIIDFNNNRHIENRTTYFYPGDRCILETPVDLCFYEEFSDYIKIEGETGITLYNGEIFDVIEAKDYKIKTELNNFPFCAQYFDCQLLKIQKINKEEFILVNINKKQIDETKEVLKRTVKKNVYSYIINIFNKKYPIMNFGYCMTIYKSQGSEWKTVFVNTRSIKASLKETIPIFKATYTALTRGKEYIYLVY